MADTHHESRSERERFGELLGASRAMRALFEQAAQLARSEHWLVITGEAGTGKDVLARALHSEGPRRTGPFITFDCASIAPALIESELFGRAEPSSAGRAGALELARGGTLLLADVAELPLSIQPRLLAALSERTFTRDAGQQPLSLDVRVISATRRPLASEAQRGRCLPALVALLSQAELTVPPLRERREDIPLLAACFLERIQADAQLAREAVDALALHDWPGNVRELRNVVERLYYALQSGSPSVRRLAPLLLSSELPGRERRPASTTGEAQAFEPGRSYREERARCEAAFEQRYVSWLLERHDGNISAAARAAEMDRKYLDKLARKHALKTRGS